MLFWHSIRFKGYWLSLFSWIILTLAMPYANALAQSDSGWLQLCSAKGVHWVQTTEQYESSAMDQCPCLSSALSVDLRIIAVANVHGFQLTVEPMADDTPSERLLIAQPRSPPRVF